VEAGGQVQGGFPRARAGLLKLNAEGASDGEENIIFQGVEVALEESPRILDQRQRSTFWACRLACSFDLVQSHVPKAMLPLVDGVLLRLQGGGFLGVLGLLVKVWVGIGELGEFGGELEDRQFAFAAVDSQFFKFLPGLGRGAAPSRGTRRTFSRPVCLSSRVIWAQ
jgi:hypothetical protein